MNVVQLQQSELVPQQLRGYYLVHREGDGFFRFNSLGIVRRNPVGGWMDDPFMATKFTNVWEAKSVAATCLRGTKVLVSKPSPQEAQAEPSIF